MARQTANSEDQTVRLLKVGERVRHVISEILTRQQVHDDTLNATTVSVTEVRMSSDLRQAKIFVKPLLGDDEEVVLQALRRNTAYLQREVAKRIGLKFAPKLKFVGDESFDEASRIDRLLADPRVSRDLGEDEE
ncbi:30S ribosome-binding factor RbfA [Altererythrobacter xixiisoli]|uniref:Ribosome-binding factor A n=1 Tax=Croceibacterium xixiisoli TaxID=1476466 RepID=A0A6I4TQW6_9SPHN|nr:30S ribosome-binding factor RbfA [Croceibacterium xixiisoli]MXO98292.1 30S ribosome-binding factor RbfA [Croceibacterium xixiisoli]